MRDWNLGPLLGGSSQAQGVCHRYETIKKSVNTILSGVWLSTKCCPRSREAMSGTAIF